jgi:lysophospholipid acyltransferase
MFALPPGTDPSKAPPTRKKRKIPRSGTPATFKAIYGTIWIVLFLKFSSLYNVEFLLSDRYMTYSLLRRIFHLYMLGFTARTKYYGVWTLTEGACILSGIGYNGIDPKTGKAKWDRLQNIRPWEVETAQNARAFLGGWNINTNLWLRNYMYLRVTPKGKKPGFRATLATFFTSAFWHGFYPGYYLAFVLASFVQTVAKSMLTSLRDFCMQADIPLGGRRLVRPLFLTPDGSTPLPSKRYYDIFTFFLTQIAFAFTVAPFIILSFKGSILVWARVYFYCIIGVALSFGIFSRSFPIRRKLQKLQHDRSTTTSNIEKIVKDEADKEGHGGLTKQASVISQASSRKEPVLGLPEDPEAEVDDIVREVKKEIEERRRRGSLTGGFDVKKLVDEKLKSFQKK